jgi:predicted lipoprotein with Yx(FWY)xxD motif
MKTSTIVWIVVAIIVVVGGIWWLAQGSGTSTPTSTTTTQTTTPTSGGETLTVGTDASGSTYLESATGMTLYTYASDTANSGTSACTGSCATTWPPYTVSSASGITLDPTATGTLGTITRADGTIQVTYNGMPLYMYAQDTAPGQANGNGVGGVWHTATP